MKPGRWALAGAAAAGVLATSLAMPPPALGFSEFPGARGLAMGEAGRADARGEQGPLVNPAGMSLARLYTIDGSYRFITGGGGHAVHASVVDSTSAFRLAGGIFYGFRTGANSMGVGHLSGHEAGLALSYPFTDWMMVGATAKYLNVSGDLEPDGQAKHSGFTADAGAIVRAGSMVTIGVAGYNLRDLSTTLAPVSLGYGIALQPIADLTFVVDALHDFTSADATRGTLTSVGGGAEYLMQRRVAFRAGGGRDGRSEHGYVTAGFAAVSELGALDVGVRQDVTGQPHATFIAVGLRLFVPQP